MELLIDNRQEKILVSEDTFNTIREVVIKSLEIENRSLDYEVSVSLVDDEEIRDLNREYREKDCATDVLSFPLEEGPNDNFDIPELVPLLGDIVISVERALEQANEFGHGLEREIAYLTAHSMFHLMGYDHLNEKEKIEMRQKEKRVMKELEIFK